jgi:hypothetical protein
MKPSSLTTSSEEMVALTGRITAAYLRGNVLPAVDVASVIGIVYSSLLQLVQPVPLQQQEETWKPAVPIRKSVTTEYIVCLEDGKKLKMLKRHTTRWWRQPTLKSVATLPGRAAWAGAAPCPNPFRPPKSAAVPRQLPDSSLPGFMHRP